MVNLGAQGSDDDLNKVLNYLVKFYGVEGRRRTGAGATCTGAAASATSPSCRKRREDRARQNAKDVTLPAGHSRSIPRKNGAPMATIRAACASLR